MKKHSRMKNYKRPIFVAAIIILVFMITPVYSAEYKNIRFATLQSPTNPMILELQKALNRITQESEGRIKFQMHYGTEAGFKAKEFVPALKRNLLDMSLVATSAAALDYPWLAVTGIPFLFPNIPSKGPALEALIPMLDEFCNENGIVPLAYPYHMDNYVIIYCNEKLNNLKNIKGKLLRIYDPNTIAITKGLGATPVNLQKSEVYMGLQRKTIDGAITGETSAKDLHFDEVTKYMVKITPMVLPNIVGVSKISWDKFKKEDQEIFKKVLLDWHKEYTKVVTSDAHEKRSFEYALTHGMEVLEPEKDMKEVFPKIKDTIIEAYLKESGTKGKKALDLVTAAIKKAGY
jgi:TRAP-type C4-dicarboxylate transport system substrate-binding protein